MIKFISLLSKSIFSNYKYYSERLIVLRVNATLIANFLFISILLAFANQRLYTCLTFLMVLFNILSLVIILKFKKLNFGKHFTYFITSFFVCNIFILYGDIYPLIALWFSLLFLYIYVFYHFYIFLITSLFYILIIFFSDDIKIFLLKHNWILYENAEHMVWFNKFQIVPYFTLLYFIIRIYKNMNEHNRKNLQLINFSLLETKINLEKSKKFKEEFYAQVSHEIRTPLNAISGLTHLLKKTKLEVEQYKLAEVINQSTDNLSALLNDIIEVSKFELGQTYLNHVNFNIKKEFEYISEIAKFLVEKTNIIFKLEYDSNIPKFLYGDPIRLRQILLNLIHNSVKFTDKGYIQLKVELLEQDSQLCKIKIQVKDTGIGIKKENINTIFNQFTYFEAKNSKYKSAGLSMYITKKFVEMMKGSIEVESEYGFGTTYSICLDLLNSKEKFPETKSQDEFNESLIDLSTYNILAVDDNEINLMILEKIFKGFGARIIKANNGIEAIKEYKLNPNFNLILMDLSMPVMGGIEATELLRNELMVSCKIIGITANIVEDVKVNALNAGMDDLITKPFKVSDLINVIK